jgi:hypothetical protein
MSPFFAALLACAWMGAVFLVTGWGGRAGRVAIHAGPHEATRAHAG